MLDVKDITISYQKRPVVQSLNFHLDQGQVLGLVGESGSGKSTIIKAILGILGRSGQVDKGQILYQGTNLTTLSERDYRKIYGKEIAMVFQDAKASLNPIRTIGSQFIEYLKSHEKISDQEARSQGIQALKMVELKDPEEIMDQYPSSLSGGMAQRVGIALALALKPKLILADEPTSALDVTNQAQIVFELERLKKKEKLTMILVTHNLAVASYLSDQLLVLEKGKVVDYGPCQEVLKNPKSSYTKGLIQNIPSLGEG